MSTGAPPSSPDPRSSRVVALSDPVAMPTGAPLCSPDPRSSPVVPSAPVAVPTDALPSSLDPRSSRVVAPSVLVAMPSPPSSALPAAAVEDETRLLPSMKMIRLPFPKAINYVLPLKTMGLLFPKAINCIFGGCINRASGMALVGLHAVIYVVKVVSFTTNPEVARLWVQIFRACVYLGLAVILLITARIFYHMRVSAVEDNPPKPKQQQAAAAVLLLPPPPPQMDMC